MLQEQFQSFVNQQKLFQPADKILLAVSGGIDSMAMLRLFDGLTIDFAVAHCNFQLRGTESDEDESFVEDQVQRINREFYHIRFETESYAEHNKLSIQMAARELRYNWFNQLCKTHEFDWVAVAHNRDDNLETFFINLGRGTSINGLTGISLKNENIIRPLLFASRNEIERFARENFVPYREDSSNSSDKYLRNYIRHNLLPSFEEIFPKFRDTLNEDISRLKDVSRLYQHAIAGFKTDVTEVKNNLYYIHIGKLLSTPAPKTLLYEILSEFNFSAPTVNEIFDTVNSLSGKQFSSTTHKLVKDREHFIIHKLTHQTPTHFYIEETDVVVKKPIQLRLQKFEKPQDFEIKKGRGTAQFDCSKLTFPLILRKWNAGDYFNPFGMKGLKKLSDFFIDQKFSLIDKENTWLLLSGQDIIWVVGHRIDERYKITQSTNEVLEINLIKDLANNL